MGSSRFSTRSVTREPRFPDFLIIGAMKSGTTSLFFDLDSHPSIFLPADKEPQDLAADHVLTPRGRRRYARRFVAARPGQVCGEASTGYTKLPDVQGVPERALHTCGDGVKAIYLVREPVSRTLSQHFHELTAGTTHPDVDVAVRTDHRLIAYSRYAMQIRPWIDALGRDNVRIVGFETYVKERRATVGELQRFLGVEPRPELVDADVVFNPAGRAPAPRGVAWRFSRGRLYRALLRPLLSRSARWVLRDLLMPPAPDRPAPPTLVTVDYILDRVRDDVEELGRILGGAEPLWDLAAVRRRYATGST